MLHPKIKTALISVYDKTGIVDFARALVNEFGIEIISTGGTAALLKQEGIPVTLVEEITGFPEMLDGRVKTLHPKIHAGILADRDNPEHMRQLAEHGIKPIDMVVVNLYPFEKMIADPNCTFEQAIEMIDIGGPCLLRAAAKNHRHVVALLARYCDVFLGYLRDALDPTDWKHCSLDNAWTSFRAAFEYDEQVSAWLERMQHGEQIHGILYYLSRGQIKYGENPHQTAQLWQFRAKSASLATADAEADDSGPGQAGMSFNNYADADAAVRLCAELAWSCGTSFQPAECGTGFQPVHSSRVPENAPPADHVRPIDGETQTWRNLPHFQTPGRTYFVTFRLQQKGTTLTPPERDIAFDACCYWDGKKLTLHGVVVMPDHVHLLITPLETSRGMCAALGEITHSIKRLSAREINKLRGAEGSLWLDESFDRIMRNEKEFLETLDYIANNPVKHGLAEWGRYPWYWDETRRTSSRTVPMPTSGGGEPREHRLETSATQVHRLQTGPTQIGSSQNQTSATQVCAPPRADATQTHATCVFVKHTNPCGVGCSADPLDAYRKAYLADPNAAMGGILACSFAITPDFAVTVMDTYNTWGKAVGAGGFFAEVWVSPSFDDAAIEIIRSRKAWGKNCRLLGVGDMNALLDQHEFDYRSISGGMLVQTPDRVGLNESDWKNVTKRSPTESELSDLRLAWLIAKHTKSNAISICKDGMLIGNGAGQMSRVMSCRIATWLAKENGHADKLPGSVAASDAFFPFDDGPKILMDAGVAAIIQPGGSKRDADTIAACDERGVAMIFTGTRHFRH